MTKRHNMLEELYSSNTQSARIDGQTWGQFSAAIRRRKIEGGLVGQPLYTLQIDYGLKSVPPSWAAFEVAAQEKGYHPAKARRDWLSILEGLYPSQRQLISRWRRKDYKYATGLGARD